jgi:hypothetical protein
MTNAPSSIKYGAGLYDLRASRPPLWVGLHDFEIPGGYDRSLPNCPEVHFLDHYTNLTEPWQWFFYGQNKPSGFTETYNKIQFAKYTQDDAFITDYHGSGTSADYVNETNLDKDPIKIKCLWTGGNAMTGTIDSQDPQWFLPSYLDAFAPPPVGMTRQTHPWYIHEATIISNNLPGGGVFPGGVERLVNPFVNFGGRNTGIGVNYPFMGNRNRVARIHVSMLRKLAPNEPIPSPYNPPM